MKRADVVIGAGFGDEGKGLMTDYLAAPLGSDALVVRFNGGAQAGHTVVTPDGRRHVFSHFASGGFVGAPGYLSRYFVINPIIHLEEAAQLAALGCHPKLYVDREARVTTPYDMLINQIVEEARGRARHGSCGIGFGETLERDLRVGFSLRAGTLEDRSHLAGKLRHIRDNWVRTRLEELGITRCSAEQEALLQGEDLIERFLGDVELFLEAATLTNISVVEQARHVIFEGAQGLKLDQDRGIFPHVTRSNTGLKNVMRLAGEAGIPALNVTYMTRAYRTRHGAGPLERELPERPWVGIEDRTNITNDFQGSLRFALLDLDELARDIAADLSDAAGIPQLQVAHRLAVTCLDQASAVADFIQADRRQMASPEGLAAAAAAAVGGKVLVSAGPTRNHLDCLEKVAAAA